MMIDNYWTSWSLVALSFSHSLCYIIHRVSFFPCLGVKKKNSVSFFESFCMSLQWDDSIDGTQEGLTDCANRLHLPNPKRKIVSPLRKYKVKNFVRKTIKRWSLLEEDTLRTGVQKYVFVLIKKTKITTSVEYIFENYRIFFIYK